LSSLWKKTDELSWIRETEMATIGLRVERKVDSTGLTLRKQTGTTRLDPSGKQVDVPMIEVDSAAVAGFESADDIAAVLSFPTDKYFMVYSSLPEHDELVPETEEDEALLDSFGTKEVWAPLSATVQVRTFHEPITPELVAALLPRHVGLQLYAEAIRHQSAAARYRDLWRVLESAFGLKGAGLVRALADFPPVQELEFTEEELEQLRLLRGGASHAESRAGIRELRRVRAEASEREGRLNTLVERVILTKKEWGSKTDEVEELARLQSWMGPPDEKPGPES
jgi:hypothetical protein